MARRMAEKFVPDVQRSIAYRVAQYFEWRYQQAPTSEDVVTYPEVAKGVFQLPSLPRPTSKEVQRVRSALSAARLILIKHFGRDLYVDRGTGARATLDSTDAVMRALPVRARRAAAAVRGLGESKTVVDAQPLRMSPESRPYVDWYRERFTDSRWRLLQQRAQELEPPRLDPDRDSKEG